MKLTKKTIYIGLFAILYLIVAFSSFWHACAFFGLANNSWMSIILAFAFEVGQAAVLFSLLTSQKDRTRFMPWVLMTVFTIVQVIGNVFSSYKYLITHSVENLRFFKEPIFIWTDLPDDQTTVIITYIVGAILPICALLLTSMITNYLTDNEEETTNSIGDLINDHSVLQMENQGLQEQNENLKKEIEELKNSKNEEKHPIQFVTNSSDFIHEEPEQTIETKESESNNDNEEEQSIDSNENQERTESYIKEDITEENNKISAETNKKPSHFINL